MFPTFLIVANTQRWSHWRSTTMSSLELKISSAISFGRLRFLPYCKLTTNDKHLQMTPTYLHFISRIGGGLVGSLSSTALEGTGAIEKKKVFSVLSPHCHGSSA